MTLNLRLVDKLPKCHKKHFKASLSYTMWVFTATNTDLQILRCCWKVGLYSLNIIALPSTRSIGLNIGRSIHDSQMYNQCNTWVHPGKRRVAWSGVIRMRELKYNWFVCQPKLLQNHQRLETTQSCIKVPGMLKTCSSNWCMWDSNLITQNCTHLYPNSLT